MIQENLGYSITPSSPTVIAGVGRGSSSYRSRDGSLDSQDLGNANASLAGITENDEDPDDL